MPNWCMNELSVDGNSDELKRFVEASMGLPAKYPPRVLRDGTCVSEPQEDTVSFFCFNALVPTPQEVLDIGFDGRDKIPANALMDVFYGNLNRPLDGYHWNIAYWGTKWDIYHDHIGKEDMGWSEGCEGISFDFDTAWSPPREWLYAVAAKFPNLSFKLHYEEPGCFFAGDLYAQDGMCIEDEYDEARCAETFAWCMEEE